MDDKMQVSKWDVIDIYFKDSNEKEAMELVDSYISKGWIEQHYESACLEDYDSCIQLMYFHKRKIKKIKQHDTTTNKGPRVS